MQAQIFTEAGEGFIRAIVDALSSMLPQKPQKW
jgi:hypothetical protein